MGDSSETYRTLVATTSHMTLHDKTILDGICATPDGNTKIIIVDPYPYGWRVYVSTDDFEVHDLTVWKDTLQMSESFIKVLKRARDLECRWVDFDRDGDPIEGIDEHKWEL